VLTKAQIESASDVAARALFDAIVDGSIPPGSPLRLKELSEQLGVSMMPIREAIRRLAALDLVEIEPRRGARVRELSMSDLEETYFARIHLETIAVWEASQRFSAADAAAAASALAAHEASHEVGDRVAARDAHERFHFSLYEASQRTWLIRSILPAWRNAERYRIDAMRHVETQGSRDHEHSQILSALIQHDGAGAVRWLTSHLTSSVLLSAQYVISDATESQQEVSLPTAEEVLARLVNPTSVAPS
jgi:DNA-binding GntR family transcriptional regulator